MHGWRNVADAFASKQLCWLSVDLYVGRPLHQSKDSHLLRCPTVAAMEVQGRAAVLTEITVHHHLIVLLVDLCAASVSSTVMVRQSSKAGFISWGLLHVTR